MTEVKPSSPAAMAAVAAARSEFFGDHKPAATLFANAVLGCLDALKSDAQAAAQANPHLDEAKLEACLKRAIPTSFLRDSFLVNQLTGQDEAAATAEVAINRKTAACEKVSTR